jgi:hypothetical protein
MKTLQECNDEVAKKYGYFNWEAFASYELTKHIITDFWKFLNEAAELYASQFKDTKEAESKPKDTGAMGYTEAAGI